VVQEMADEIYSVRARGTWYPGRGAQFATYDATFHYPENLDLISAGIIKEDQTQDGVHTTHRVSEGRLRLLGFNLGRYTKRESQKNGLTLEVSANRNFEASLRPAPVPVIATSPIPSTHTIRAPQVIGASSIPADPVDRVNTISADALAALEY